MRHASDERFGLVHLDNGTDGRRMWVGLIVACMILGVVALADNAINGVHRTAVSQLFTSATGIGVGVAMLQSRPKARVIILTWTAVLFVVGVAIHWLIFH
jgi:hypothetical protein